MVTTCHRHKSRKDHSWGSLDPSEAAYDSWIGPRYNYQQEPLLLKLINNS